MSAVVKQYSVSAMAVAMLLLAGCSQPAAKPSASSEPVAAKKPAGPPELVTAKTAFWPMYTAARNWATDLMVLSVTSEEVPGFKNEGGKAAMWQATFGSPSLRQYRDYTYAITTVPPDIHEGVAAGLTLPWTGLTRASMPIDPTTFNVDSDAAYQTAAADGAAWLKKNPKEGLSAFELGQSYRFPAPTWYLMWGNKKDGYIVFINATSGKLVKPK